MEKNSSKKQVPGDAPELVLGVTADAVVSPSPEDRAGAELQNQNTEQSLSPVIEVEKELVKIRVLLPLAGKFLLPHDPGAVIEINPNQAEAIVEAGYAEYVVEEVE